ncbi:MAG: signal recognition particle-docking protein FtsY [Candidatus Woesearchaeota archaeon]|jgi:fused signal recognition particle receptor
MFSFLKKKLQDGIAKLTGEVKKEVVEETKIDEDIKESEKENHTEETIKEKESKTEQKSKEPSKDNKKEEKMTSQSQEIKQSSKEEIAKNNKLKENKDEKNKEQKEEKSGFMDFLTKKTLSLEKFEELFWDIEIALLESNIAVEVIEKIKEDLKEVLVDKKINRFKIEQTIKDTLNKSLSEILEVPKEKIIDEIKNKKNKPYVIVFIGINGGGKTTSIAKMCKYLQLHKQSVVVAACDTFRAAAIHQIEEHTNRLNVKLIKHDYGADAAAVAFDAKAHAKAKDIDVLLVDTAGRNHSNRNLMDELEKLIKIAEPDKIMFIGDALTGNDAVEQAREFNDKVGIDGIILTKSDCDEKGGCAISMSYITKKPILFMGTGQRYEDFVEFEPKFILEKLSLDKSEDLEDSHILDEQNEEENHSKENISEEYEKKDNEIEEETKKEFELEEKEEEIKEELIKVEEELDEVSENVDFESYKIDEIKEEKIKEEHKKIEEHKKEELKQKINEKKKEIKKKVEEKLQKEIKKEEPKVEIKKEPIVEVSKKTIKEEKKQEKEIIKEKVTEKKKEEPKKQEVKKEEHKKTEIKKEIIKEKEVKKAETKKEEHKKEEKNKIEEKAKVEEPVKEEPKKGFFARLFGKK